MSKLFMDIITAFREYAENVGKEKELFPEIIKAVSQNEGRVKILMTKFSLLQPKT